MKKLFYLLALAMLPLAFTACGDDDEENITPQEQENKDDNTNNPDDPENQDIPEVKDIIVEVDEDGKANDGHHFTEIDASNFYIDDIKYTASQGNLIVSGYDQAYFNGEANIITTLKYDGRTMNVTEIRANVFKNCTVLTSITIPNNVISIGSEAFSGCSGMASIKVENSNSKYDSRNGCNAIIETETNNLIIGCKNTTIPNGVTSIGDYALDGCSGLTSISIPNGVTSIGDYAFYRCSSLTSVTIGNGVTSIGAGAFNCCSGLTSITIPNSVTSIGRSAFANCIGLKDVYCYATTPPSTYYTFYSTNLLTLHVPAQSIDTYKSTSPWSGFGSIVAIE